LTGDIVYQVAIGTKGISPVIGLKFKTKKEEKMEELSLEDIMKSNVKPTSLRSTGKFFSVYLKSGQIRLSKPMQRDLGDPSRIAFFIKGSYVFFIPDPDGNELTTFCVNKKSVDCTISSVELAKQLGTALNVKMEDDTKSFQIVYDTHSTNKFGIIFKASLRE